jgi:signal transduction histidine kinase
LKLLTRTSIYYISFSVIGFLIGGIVMYYFISRIICNRTDDTLITEKELIEEQIASSDNLPDFTVFFGHQIVVTIYNERINGKELIKDTMIYDSIKDEMQPLRYLSAIDTKSNKTYSIEIFKPLLETHQLVVDIFIVLSVMFLSLLIVLAIVNYFISQRIWSPFYNTLRELKVFDVDSGLSPVFENSDVAEFRQLNRVLRQMSSRMRRDYLNLKEFTENVSHEIQTPLAIIKTKLELLIQSEKLDENQMQLIQTIYESASRLARLNQALNLIAKIDNNQFQNTEPCNISNLVEKFISTLDDLIDDKHLTIIRNIDKEVFVEMNPILAEILLNNLMSNAIKHNIPNGKIEITLSDQLLNITNTGEKTEISASKLFQRFQKANKASNSLGLGLSIVKKIVNQNQISIFYNQKDGLHTVKLLLKKNIKT